MLFQLIQIWIAWKAFDDWQGRFSFKIRAELRSKCHRFNSIRQECPSGTGHDEPVLISCPMSHLCIIRVSKGSGNLRLFQDFLRPCWAKFKTILNRYAIIKTPNMRLHMNNLMTISFCHSKISSWPDETGLNCHESNISVFKFMT